MQEFDLEIKDKKRFEIVVVDHLPRQERSKVTNKEKSIVDEFTNDKLFLVTERPLLTWKISNLVLESKKL